MQKIMETLGENVDYVIVDAPPLLLVTEAAVVSRFASGIILAIAAGSTKRQEVCSAVAAVEASGSALLGVIPTKFPAKGPDRMRMVLTPKVEAMGPTVTYSHLMHPIVVPASGVLPDERVRSE